MDRWSRIPLGAEVGLGPGDIVLDGDPAPPTEIRGTAAPTFRPTALTPIPQARILPMSCIVD